MRRGSAASGGGPAGGQDRPLAPADDLVLADAEVTDRGGYPYIVHPLMDGIPRVRPELVRAWTAWAWEQKPLRHADLLLAPEAMALPLVAPLGMESGLPYVVARKRVYGRPEERMATAKTGYGTSSFSVNDVGHGDRVLIVDDVLSSGATMDALLAAVKACGATPVGALVFLDKGDARKDLEAKHRVPILAMRSVLVVGGRLVARDTQ